MFASTGEYFRTLSDRFGDGWNRFWMTPGDVLPLCFLRVLVGAVALYHVLSFTPDLISWFAADGLMPRETVRQLAGDTARFYPSYFNLLTRPTELWIAHGLSAAVVLLFTLGLYTRAASVGTFLVIVSYHHRAPAISGLIEPVLAMLVLYLCLAPVGRELSLDRLLGRHADSKDDGEANGGRAAWTATLARRLIQVHVSLIYFFMALVMLGWTGEVSWWNGRAMELIVRQPWSPLSGLGDVAHVYVMNLWTHFIVWFSLVAAVLLWVPLARPLLVALATVMWFSLVAATGLLGFCLAMLIGTLAFVSGDAWRACAGRLPDRLLLRQKPEA